MQSSRLQRSHDGTDVSRLLFLTEFGKPYGAELQGGRGRTAMVAFGLWLGSGAWWYCGFTWVIYCRLADCCAEGENGVRKWVRNFRFVLHTFLQRRFFPRLPCRLPWCPLAGLDGVSVRACLFKRTTLEVSARRTQGQR